MLIETSSPIVVTGAAGFIGFFLAKRLLEAGHRVVGIDVMSDYYDVSLKAGRLEQLSTFDGFRFEKGDLADAGGGAASGAPARPDLVVNLAAQAGVRFSLENPHAYVQSNLVGFLNVLEACRHNGVKHLVYASTSSVYGANKKVPFAVEDNVDRPVSFYAATKKSNELMAHAYSHLYGLPVTGLRFFTVYGPWGRPDMAYFLFTRAILEGRPIDVFNNGESYRDFTYVDDIVEGICQVAARTPSRTSPIADAASIAAPDGIPYRLYNIGNNVPEKLTTMIEILEEKLGRKAEKRYLPLQPGDVVSTWADIDALQRDTNFKPSTPLAVGLGRFVDWYRAHYAATQRAGWARRSAGP